MGEEIDGECGQINVYGDFEPRLTSSETVYCTTPRWLDVLSTEINKAAGRDLLRDIYYQNYIIIFTYYYIIAGRDLLRDISARRRG